MHRNSLIESTEQEDDLEKRADLKYTKMWGQKPLRTLYHQNNVQIGIAGLIFLNFFFAAIQKWILPEAGSTADQVFEVFEWIFTIMFAVELVLNMYGNWWLPFFADAWNWFDLIVVSISIVSLVFPGIPGVSVLRLFRALRVFRLFKRIKSLKMIIEGVLAALPGVSNAMVVFAILMGIWSIMGVEFFGDIKEEEFGNFPRAMFTMWQVMTMDSWASSIARSIMYEHEMPLAAMFFVSYIFVAGMIMVNVVVAILLEKYLGATQADDNDDDFNVAPPMADDMFPIDVKIFVSCRNLIKMDFLSLSDPQVKMFKRHHISRKWMFVAATEQIDDDHNPDFKTQLVLDNTFRVQEIKFEVHDADGEDTDLMGQAIITVRQLISQEEGEKEKEYPLTNPTMPKREKKLTKSGALCTFKVEIEENEEDDTGRVSTVSPRPLADGGERSDLRRLETMILANQTNMKTVLEVLTRLENMITVNQATTCPDCNQINLPGGLHVPGRFQ